MSKGIDLKASFECRLRRIRLALVIKKAAKNQPIDFAGSGRNEVTIGVGRWRMAWTKNQILAAFAFVWTGATHVDNKAKKGVIHGAWPCSRGHLNHHRPVTEIQKGRGVHRVGVAGEPERCGAHQLLKQTDISIWLQAIAIAVADVEHLDRCSRHEIEEGLHTTTEIHLTAGGLFCGFIGEAIEIAECADAGTNNIWR